MPIVPWRQCGSCCLFAYVEVYVRAVLIPLCSRRLLWLDRNWYVPSTLGKSEKDRPNCTYVCTSIQKLCSSICRTFRYNLASTVFVRTMRRFQSGVEESHLR